METTIELTLFENNKNIQKKEVMSAFEILMDDEKNTLPEEWFNFWNANAGSDMPWGTKINVFIESIINNGKSFNLDFNMTLNETEKNVKISNYKGAFELMVADEDNVLPTQFIDFLYFEAGDDIPWNSKTKIILKLIID